MHSLPQIACRLSTERSKRFMATVRLESCVQFLNIMLFVLKLRASIRYHAYIMIWIVYLLVLCLE